MMVMETTVNVKVEKGILKEIRSGVSYIEMEKNWACFICLFGKKAKYYMCKQLSGFCHFNC